jgi:hypothetical protein
MATGKKAEPVRKRGPQTARRAAKQRLQDRLRRDSEAVKVGSLLSMLRRQGYEELPLEEIQDRLSKLRTALAEFIVTRRT